uniref:Uncharacterized protein n=1 Tax=Anguilla anguilla TaxID=7936 RepID=A0A0E9SEA1_ANGAN
MMWLCGWPNGRYPE